MDQNDTLLTFPAAWTLSTELVIEFLGEVLQTMLLIQLSVQVVNFSSPRILPLSSSLSMSFLVEPANMHLSRQNIPPKSGKTLLFPLLLLPPH